MIWVYLFSITQAVVSGYALWRGGVPERVAAVLLLLATAASLAIPHDVGNYLTVLRPLAMIDAVLFCALLALALVADRYWPLRSRRRSCSP